MLHNFTEVSITTLVDNEISSSVTPINFKQIKTLALSLGLGNTVKTCDAEAVG
jgi:hypothetical protein